MTWNRYLYLAVISKDNTVLWEFVDFSFAKARKIGFWQFYMHFKKMSHSKIVGFACLFLQQGLLLMMTSYRAQARR